MPQPPVSLRLFGGVSLLRDGTAVSGRASQRRRLGVLLVLAASPGGKASRDRLLAILWPETRTDSARHLLSSAVYELRRTLGARALLTLGDDIALNPVEVDCDVQAFESAVSDGRLNRAVTLAQGEFGEGFHISRAPEFDRWLDETRSRYRTAVRLALTRLAQENPQAGTSADVAERWLAVARTDPADPVLAVQAAQALRASGEPHQALRLCQDHVALVERELGIQPDPRVSQLVADLMASLAERPATGPAARSANQPSPAPEPLPARSRKPRPALVGLAAAGVMVFTLALTRHSGADVDRSAGNPTSLSKAALEGTRSAAALAAWQAGERSFRSGHFLAAEEYFGHAAAADSNFALAFYRLSQARLAADLPEADATVADRRLERLATALPERERLLVSAYRAFRVGNAEYAEQRYQSLVTRYPDDAEAWLQLGESRFHYGPQRGIPLGASEAAFRRAAELDPGNWGPIWHLALLRAMASDRRAATGAIDRLLRLRPDRSDRMQLLLLRSTLTGDREAQTGLLHQLQDADELVLFQLTWRLAVYFREPHMAERVAAILIDPARPTYSQGLGRLSLAHLRLAAADEANARRHLTAALALPGFEGNAYAALVGLLLVPGVATDSAELRTVRDSLRVREGTASVEGRPHYLVLRGYVEAALGHADSVQAIAGRLIRSGSQDWALMLHAEAASRDGRYEEVVRLLRDRGPNRWYGHLVGSLQSLEARSRFLRAEAYERLGRLQPALSWYGSLGEFALADLVYLRPALDRCRSISRQLGGRASAWTEGQLGVALGPAFQAGP